MARGGFLVVGLCSLMLEGCIWMGNDRLFEDGPLTQIKAGETTKAQVIALLGEPNYLRQTIMSGHSYEWWGYDAERSWVNPLEYLLIVGLFVNGIGTPDDRRDLHLFFNPDGVVTHVHQQTTNYETGGVLTTRNVTSKVHTSISQPVQPGGLTGYQDMLAVSPGP